MSLHNTIKKANDIIKSSQNCYFAIVGEDGYPHVATRSFCTAGDIQTCYISTNTSGNLAQTLMKNNKASMCIHEGNDNITMMGIATIVEDEAVRQQMWMDWFIDHYPGGYTDPEYCVIRFDSQRLSIWLDRSITKVTVDEIVKVQSCCGLLCDRCSYQDSHDCKGCIANAGKQFWGTCPIATCCMTKGYTHCGQCDDMPCDILEQFSCGDSDNSDSPKGARIEILKIWDK